MSLGKVLSRVALLGNKHTTWFPSYGAEVRGGTAHCFVKISDKSIASPLVEQPDIAIIFNQPSMDRFEKRVKTNGLLIANIDSGSERTFRKDIITAVFSLNKIAMEECGSVKVANSLALGILFSLKPGLFTRDNIKKVFGETFKEDLFEQNIKAFRKGEEIGKS